ncbi:MAG: hypothetical protein J7M25_04080 [Deltaproteobacteria bacterium]|nr:hypothetical protein [Deltaproteobacteria bacterium]
MKTSGHTGKRNRWALIVGFVVVTSLAGTDLVLRSTSAHPDHLKVAEDALGNWLAGRPGASTMLERRLHRALNTWDRRPKVLAALTERLRQMDPACNPNRLQQVDQAVCLIRRGCLERATRIYHHVLTGSDRTYVTSLLKRLSHRVSCRLGEPSS